MKIQKWFVETIQFRVQLTSHTGLSARREKIVLFGFAVALFLGTAHLTDLQAQQSKPKAVSDQQSGNVRADANSRTNNPKSDSALMKRIVLFPVRVGKSVTGVFFPRAVKKELATKEPAMKSKPRPTNLQQDFILEGTLTKSELEEDGSSIYVKLTLQFQLRNVGPVSLLFRRQEAPVFIGLALSKTPRFEPEDLIKQYIGGPSIDVSERWRQLRETLDADSPAETVIRKLQPNETWSFEEEASIVTSKAAGSQNQLTVNKHAVLSPIWVKIFFEVWSPNIEPDVERRSELRFGKALQERWRNYGYLFLDDIESAPILLDVNAANLGNKVIVDDFRRETLDNSQATEQPKVTLAVKPAYPPIAAARRISGEVRIDVAINPDGFVTETRLNGGHPILQKAAQEAALRWRFNSARPGGRLRPAILVFNFLPVSSLNQQDGFKPPYQMTIKWIATVVSSESSAAKSTRRQ